MQVRGEAGLLVRWAAAFSGGGQYDVAANGTLVYLNGKPRDPRWTLAVADAGGKIQPLPLGPAQYRAPTVSPDGRSLAWMTANQELWVYDIARETATRILSKSSHMSKVIWTPDSKHLVGDGLSGNAAGESIWCMRADGTGQSRQVLAQCVGRRSEFLLSDGKWLAIQIMNERLHFDIAMLPMDWSDPDGPGRKPVLVSHPRLSPRRASRRTANGSPIKAVTAALRTCLSRLFRDQAGVGRSRTREATFRSGAPMAGSFS